MLPGTATLLFDDSPRQREARKAFAELIKFGTPVTVPAVSITGLAVDAPAGLGGEFPGDADPRRYLPARVRNDAASGGSPAGISVAEYGSDPAAVVEPEFLGCTGGGGSCPVGA